MNIDRLSIEELRSELQALQLAARNIERLIEQTEEELSRNDTANQQDNQRLRDRRQNIVYRGNHPVVRDREGTEILIGDDVRFLTPGVHNSRTGTIYKVSNNGARVTARDNNERSVSRAPHNVTVLLP